MKGNPVCTILVAFLMTFCFVQSSFAENGQLLFVAELNTNSEVPPVRGDATGLITFLLSEDLKSLQVHGAFSNLTGTITACNLHKGAFDVNGPELLNLLPYVQGKRIKADLATPDSFIELATLGEIYVNIKTSGFPNGEIRGQLYWRAEFLYPVALTGGSQIPPNASSGFGFGNLRFSPNLTRMSYKILLSGLSGPVKAAHIHAGGELSNGPVLADLGSGNLLSGEIADPQLVQDVFFNLIDSGAYVNVHTDSFPDGELRGQILFGPVFSNDALLNGDQETPAVVTTARGVGFSLLNFPDLDSLNYFVFYEGVDPVAAHIHRGAAGQSGPVVAEMTRPSLFTGVYSGVIPLSEEDLKAYLKDELYFNIHSSNFPDGEIRGQFQNNLMKAYAFDLCGDQEVPKKTVPANGAAHVAINKANTELEYTLYTTDVNGDAVSTNIRDGAFGANGPVLLSINLPNPYAFGVVNTTGTLASKIESDNAYINVFTAANPSGELRGQIRRGLSCKVNTGSTELSQTHFGIYNNLVANELAVMSELGSHERVEYQITDVQGTILQKNALQMSAGLSKAQLDVHTFSPGIYFLQLRTDSKSPFQTLKWIKM